jgi:hypothetical protein
MKNFDDPFFNALVAMATYRGPSAWQLVAFFGGIFLASCGLGVFVTWLVMR